MNRINEKINEIEKFLEELEPVLPGDLNEYLRDWKIRDICERHFEKIIEGVVDLSFLFIKEKALGYPKDDENSFDILFNHNIISKELLLKLKDAKGMRNIIAHEYGKINDDLVFEAVKEQLIPDVREFIKAVKGRLK